METEVILNLKFLKSSDKMSFLAAFLLMNEVCKVFAVYSRLAITRSFHAFLASFFPFMLFLYFSNDCLRLHNKKKLEIISVFFPVCL